MKRVIHYTYYTYICLYILFLRALVGESATNDDNDDDDDGGDDDDNQREMKIAVIENEYGAVSIDTALVEENVREVGRVESLPYPTLARTTECRAGCCVYFVFVLHSDGLSAFLFSHVRHDTNNLTERSLLHLVVHIKTPGVAGTRQKDATRVFFFSYAACCPQG